jgi:hypothetical protein
VQQFAAANQGLGRERDWYGFTGTADYGTSFVGAAPVFDLSNDTFDLLQCSTGRCGLGEECFLIQVLPEPPTLLLAGTIVFGMEQALFGSRRRRSWIDKRLDTEAEIEAPIRENEPAQWLVTSEDRGVGHFAPGVYQIHRAQRRIGLPQCLLAGAGRRTWPKSQIGIRVRTRLQPTRPLITSPDILFSGTLMLIVGSETPTPTQAHPAASFLPPRRRKDEQRLRLFESPEFSRPRQLLLPPSCHPPTPAWYHSPAQVLTNFFSAPSALRSRSYVRQKITTI